VIINVEIPNAHGIDIRLAAIGRKRFLGCMRSFWASTESLMK